MFNLASPEPVSFEHVSMLGEIDRAFTGVISAPSSKPKSDRGEKKLRKGSRVATRSGDGRSGARHRKAEGTRRVRWGDDTADPFFDSEPWDMHENTWAELLSIIPKPSAPSDVPSCRSQPGMAHGFIHPATGRAWKWTPPCGNWACGNCRRSPRAWEVLTWCVGPPVDSNEVSLTYISEHFGCIPNGVFPDIVYMCWTFDDQEYERVTTRARRTGADYFMLNRPGGRVLISTQMLGHGARWAAVEREEQRRMLLRALTYGVTGRASSRPWVMRLAPSKGNWDFGPERFEHAFRDYVFRIASELAYLLYGERPQFDRSTPEGVPVGAFTSKDGRQLGWGWLGLVEWSWNWVATNSASIESTGWSETVTMAVQDAGGSCRCFSYTESAMGETPTGSLMKQEGIV